MQKILFLLIAGSLFSCQKNHTPEVKELVIDDFLNGKYNTKTRALTRIKNIAGYPLLKIKKTTNVIFLDFDGHQTTENSIWGAMGFEHSGLTPDEQDSVLNRVRRYFFGFDVYVTEDERLYNMYVPKRRQRVVISETHLMMAGGTAYINSRSWGDDTECFVFSKLLYYNVKHISGAVAHEVGHTLGLRHQATYDNGVMTHEYSEGFTPDRSPIMGRDYNDPDGGEWIEFPMKLGLLEILRAFTATHQNDKAHLRQHDKLGIK